MISMQCPLPSITRNSKYTCIYKQDYEHVYTHYEHTIYRLVYACTVCVYCTLTKPDGVTTIALSMTVVARERG